MDFSCPSIANVYTAGGQCMGTTEQLNNFEVHSNTPSNLCCVSTSAGPQKLVPLDAYGRPDINRWMTTYHGDYNTYHDPRDGITFNWKTEEEQKQEKATCIGCQHSPATPIVPPLGTIELCGGKITVSPYSNLQLSSETPKRIPKDVYGEPDTYRWKTEYDSSYNINPDVSKN
ncbi:uncharacterized protein LOC134346664 isoform X5 [Mobula hypostoma]|uniref:uncharacterized protein LOC134346664 isoform X5 n=1 Tax=Mobula hypostoma TaxID=723540 RepID=UPI002FC2A81C